MASKKAKPSAKLKKAKPVEWRERLIKIERMPASVLLDHPLNPKIHPDSQKEPLAGLLSEVGKVDILKAYLSERNEGALTLWDGHCRRELRPDEMWNVGIYDLTDDEADLLLATFDPIGWQAEQSKQRLESLMDTIKAGNSHVVSFLAEQGARLGIISQLNGHHAEGAGGDDYECVVDEETEPIARLGDIWQLGEHRIACIDATNAEQVKRLCADLPVAFVWADPPYGIEIVAANVSVGGGEAYDIPFGGRKGCKGNVGGTAAHIAKTGMTYMESSKLKGLGTANGSKPFGSKAIRGTVGSTNIVEAGKYFPVIGDDSTDTAVGSYALAAALFPGAVHVWWGGNYYANNLPPSSCWLVWDKENTGNFADCELAWTNQDKAARIFKHMWNGMLKDSEHGQRRIHPTQKPVALARWCFEKYGRAEDVIFDPFLGSGISVIAAERLKRKVIGCELSPHYIDAICKRWEAETGKKARKAKR